MVSFQSNGPVPNANNAVGTGVSLSDPFITVFMDRDPTPYDFNYPIKKRWINLTQVTEWILVSFINTSGQSLANWVNLSLYQTDTFVPTLQGGTTIGDTIYTLQSGTYTRIGNLVTVFVLLVTTSSDGTGDLIVASLPFSVKNQSIFPEGAVSMSSPTFPVGTTSLSFQGFAAFNAARINCSGSGVTGAYLQIQNIPYVISGTLTYQI